MANRHRREVPLDLGGRRLALRLTLGGLTELVDALGAGDLVGLGERLGRGRIAARDIIAILRIGLKGAGHDLAEGEIKALSVAGGLEPIAALFTITFGSPVAAGVARPDVP
ncbi:MAG: gene transfer agent family protein [Hyphomicrobiales bacterium]|nr:gene transfer agent family protein [Hyphomicrobiales bacterium]